MQTYNVTVQRMYRLLPIAAACELHERMMQGRADMETRSLLKSALRRVGRIQERS